MKKLSNRLIFPVAVIICIAILGSTPSYGRTDSEAVKEGNLPPNVTVTEGGKVTFEFDNADIRVIIKYVSDLTGQNFIIDKDVRGVVSVLTPTTIPLQDTMDLLESILEMQGYALVPSGDFIEVMNKKAAARRAMPVILEENEEAAADEMVTRIIWLKHGSSRRMYDSLKHLFGNNISVIPYYSTNSLIITGISSNISRMAALIKELDKPTGEKTQDIRPLILRYSRLTGKNIVVGDVGSRKVTVFSSEGLSDEELLDSMETIISTAGLTMEERGDVIVIEPDPDRAEEMEGLPDQGDRSGMPTKTRYSKRNG
jgi:type II secretory pathway component GspD/PulD (secretin)